MALRTIKSKWLLRDALNVEREKLRRDGKTVVFTNGCFDILHTGHASYLDFARRQGDALIVGVNSDASVKSYKDPSRPIVPQDDRARMVAALECVDYVVIFVQHVAIMQNQRRFLKSELFDPSHQDARLLRLLAHDLDELEMELARQGANNPHVSVRTLVAFTALALLGMELQVDTVSAMV